MIRYVYIITNTEKTMLHTGMTKDIYKTMKFYNEMPTLFYDGRKLSHLVYLEELPSEEKAMERFKSLSAGGKEKQLNTISETNPDWLELLPGVNIHP